MLDGRPADRTASTALTRDLAQQAPPTNLTARRVQTPARQVGPLSIGTGTLTSQARWDPAMACGRGTGEVTRAQASFGGTTVLSGRSGRVLVGVPLGLQGLSTTALERRGTDVHTVSRATVTGSQIRLLGDAVRVRIVRAPSLTTSISANDGSTDVRYVPAVLEVSGAGFATRRLETPGDQLDVALPAAGRRPESTPSVAGDPLRTLLSGVRPGALFGLAPGAAHATDLPGLPPRPGVPSLGDGDTESDATVGDQSTLRIWIGGLRQAVSGHAVAARAVAVRVQIVAGTPKQDRGGAGYGSRLGGVILDLDVGVLATASVAPDPGMAGGSGAGAQADAAAGTGGGGLPVTGHRIDLTVLLGGALLVGGFGFLVFGLRRRQVHA
jgi:hypothetical protein